MAEPGRDENQRNTTSENESKSRKQYFDETKYPTTDRSKTEATHLNAEGCQKEREMESPHSV